MTYIVKCQCKDNEEFLLIQFPVSLEHFMAIYPILVEIVGPDFTIWIEPDE